MSILDFQYFLLISCLQGHVTWQQRFYPCLEGQLERTNMALENCTKSKLNCTTFSFYISIL
uniref:Putative ovule protein n=1 Tax=Solanum chacoense TaxID=4108 RepID=A0A0V0GQL9_SOLCH